MARSPDESFLDNTIQFVMPKNPDDLVPSLFNYLIAAKGDPGSYAENLTKFYQCSLLLKNRHHKPSQNEAVVDPITVHHDAINVELSIVFNHKLITIHYPLLKSNYISLSDHS